MATENQELDGERRGGVGIGRYRHSPGARVLRIGPIIGLGGRPAARGHSRGPRPRQTPGNVHRGPLRGLTDRQRLLLPLVHWGGEDTPAEPGVVHDRSGSTRGRLHASKGMQGFGFVLVRDRMARMLIVDVEASGTEAKKHSIVSVGALDLANPGNRFYEECRVWDGAHIMDEALAVNGFTKEQITDPKKQSEGDLIHAFLHWSESVPERTLAGQNVSFDRGFLKAAAERAGHTEWPFAYRTIDTHTLAYMHMINRGVKPPVMKRRSALDLDAVLNYCGIQHEPEPHNALTGALSHAEVISRLLYGREPLPEVDQFHNPLEKVDMRVKAVEVPEQKAITKDNIAVGVTAVIYYKVVDAGKAILEVEDFIYAMSQLAQTTMRNAVGEVELDDLLSQRDKISERISMVVDEASELWGIKVSNVELKDISLPENMERTIAKQAEAEREKRAVIIKAEGEVMAAENMAKAATMLAAAPGALHLRTLQSINDISSDQSNTVVFAVPLEVLRALDKLTGK